MGAADDWIASLGHGHPLLIATVIAVLLGLRHASDPDHLAAVVTIVAAEDDRRIVRAARLGFVWGVGHGTSLIVFGIPIVVAASYLPSPVKTTTDVIVGCTIIALGIRLFIRTRPGARHVPVRSRAAAYGIGLVHGMGGSAGLGLLLLASIANRALALTALFLFAAFAAISMTLVSAAFAATLDGPTTLTRIQRVGPLLGAVSGLFGCWYVAGALALVPYPS